MPPQTIEEYVRWVLDEDPTLEKVDPEVRQQLEADYVEALENEVTAAIVSELSEEQLAMAEKMLEHSTKQEFQAWVEHYVPNINDVISGVLLRFRAEYLSGNDAG